MMKTGKAIMQPFDALTAAKYLLLVELVFTVGRDAVQSVPNLSAVVTLKGGNLEGLPVSSGNVFKRFASSRDFECCQYLRTVGYSANGWPVGVGVVLRHCGPGHGVRFDGHSDYCKV